jgi:hypothetical protein
MLVRSFSTTSRPALRAAASGGRPRAGNDTVRAGEPAPPSDQSDPFSAAFPERRTPAYYLLSTFSGEVKESKIGSED